MRIYKSGLLFLILVSLFILLPKVKQVYSYGAWCPADDQYYSGGPECAECHLDPVDCNMYYWFCVDGAGSDCVNCHAEQVGKYCIMAPYVTVTAAAGPNGSVSPSGSIEVEPYSDATLTFTPIVGYQVEDIRITKDFNYYEISVGPARSYTIPNVTQNHFVEATFTALPPCSGSPVLLDTYEYVYIQDAYDDIVGGSNENIFLHSKSLGEDLIMDRDVDVILKGGYGCDFNEPPVSFSATHSMTISGGTVGVENLILTE